MREALRIPSMMLWLTVLWVALWGSVTWANVIGGVAVATAVVLSARLDPASRRTTYFRPHWALWYVLNVGWQLVVSNIRLAREILTPGDGTHTAIVAVAVRGGSDAVVNLVANSITLTPGTLTIDVKRGEDGAGRDDTVTLYVHGIFAKDLDAVRDGVLRLEALALRAFGSPEDAELAQADVEEHARRRGADARAGGGR